MCMSVLNQRLSLAYGKFCASVFTIAKEALSFLAAFSMPRLRTYSRLIICTDFFLGGGV